jgi:enolase
MGRECLQRSKPPTITKVKGREILDSRGNPTVEVDVYSNYLGAENALVARAGAPCK